MNPLKITGVTVLIHDGTDRITLDLDAPTPFPEMMYEAKATIEARQGYGVEWVKRTLGIEPKVIDTRQTRSSFSRKAPR